MVISSRSCQGTYCIKVLPLYCLHSHVALFWWIFPRPAATQILGELAPSVLSRGPLVSFRPGQPTQKCSSSSTMRELHVLHVLSSTGRQTYLPVSICSGAVPPLMQAGQQRSVRFYSCSLYVSFSLTIVCFKLNIWSQLWFTYNVRIPILPL